MKTKAITHPILGTLPHGWTVEKLLDLCTYLRRGAAPTYVENSEVLALNQKAIRWGYIEEDHLKCHDPEVPIEEKHFLCKDDIVINSTGDITIGRAYHFRAAPGKLFADSHVTIVRVNHKKIRPEYLVSLLATPEYQDLIYSMVTGSTGQLELNKSNLEKLPILCPPIELQEDLNRLWQPLFESIDLAAAMRKHGEAAIRLLLDKHVLNTWKNARCNGS